LVVETVRALKNDDLWSGGTGDIYGIVGTVSVIARRSVRLVTTMRFFILISANLAVMNLLPIPGWMDASLSFWPSRNPRQTMDPNREGLVHLIGFALIALLRLR
jgi:regulator of sigma E protease